MESAIYIVATPIGNLGDLSFRALEVLNGVDLIAAEDTRHTRRLLDHFDVSTKMCSLHEHNERERAEELIKAVAEGSSLALVSDAGTPLISDPGHILVSMARDAGVKVVPVPGACAITAALCASGVPCGRFVFEGFLPAKALAKKACLEAYLYESKTVVFYESPHRVLDTLSVMSEVFADRTLALARELTKRFETIYRGSVVEVRDWVEEDTNQQKGEFVLVLAGASEERAQVGDDEKVRVMRRLLKDLPPKAASAIVADLMGGSKKEAYNIALSLRE